VLQWQRDLRSHYRRERQVEYWVSHRPTQSIVHLVILHGSFGRGASAQK
jgi:hypothetical protein